MGFNDLLADGFVDIGTDLLRVGEVYRSDILGFLHSMEEDLQRQIDRFDIEGVKRVAFKRRRMERLIEQVRETIRSAYLDSGRSLRHSLVELGHTGRDLAVSKVNGFFGGPLLQTVLHPTELRTVIAAPDFIVGRPLQEYWSEQSAKVRRRFAQEIRLGVVAGETNEQLVHRIIGKRTGRNVRIRKGGKWVTVPQRKGGVMDVTRRQATATVRTAVMSVSNKVNEEVYRANQDVLRGHYALVTLDDSTTIICIGRSGGAWDFDGNPLPESTVQSRYPGDPPWHVGCRTIMSVMTKTWEEMGARVKALEVTDKLKASIDGLVPQGFTYEHWLRTKSQRFQMEKLGIAKWRLWKEGKLKSLSQLLDQTGRPLTEAELTQKHG